MYKLVTLSQLVTKNISQIVLTAIFIIVLSACGAGEEGIEVDNSITSQDTQLTAPNEISFKAHDKTLYLSWPLVRGAESYKVYYSKKQLIDIQNPDLEQVVVSDSLPTAEHVLKTLDLNSIYYIAVSASSSTGEELASSEYRIVFKAQGIDVSLAPPNNFVAESESGQIKLSWDAMPEAISYIIYYSSDDPLVEPTNARQIVDIAQAPYIHKSPVSGRNYYYRISAETPAGNTPLSAVKSAVSQAEQNVPATPKSFSATAGDGIVALGWEPVPNATSYTLFMAQEPDVNEDNVNQLQDGKVFRKLENVSTNRIQLENNRTYYFSVAAVNEVGASKASISIAATPKSLQPDTPANLRASSLQNAVQLSWGEIPDATKYTLYWANEPEFDKESAQSLDDISDAEIIHDHLTEESVNYYFVTAHNDKGESEASAVVSAVPIVIPPAPAAPGELKANITLEEIVLTWEAIAGAEEYVLYMANEAGINQDNYIQLENGVRLRNISNNSFTFTNLQADTDYYLAVAAVNQGGEGAISTEIHFKTPPIVDPDPPTVSAQNVENNASDVPLNQIFEYTFSENIKSSTVNTESVVLIDSEEKPVATSVSLNNTILNIQPLESLQQNSTYSVILARTIQDLAGNAMLEDFNHSFSTIVLSLKPVISLNGDAQISLIQGQEYLEQGATASDNEEGDISERIVISHDINTQVPGVYTVNYNVSDNSGLAADEVTRTVTIVENQKPAIALNGNNPLNIVEGVAYAELGAKASDSEDGDLTEQIKITGEVDTSNVGSYSIFYNVTDSLGKAADEVIRVVNVLANQRPVISLSGDNPETVVQGQTYIEAGATAKDPEDGELSGIQISGEVNTLVPGSYSVKYNIKDSLGLAALEVTRIVNVTNPGQPSISLEGDNPLVLIQGQEYIEEGATATDPEDGDITSSINIESNVDTDSVGTYSVTYTVQDSGGTDAIPVVRTVEVIGLTLQIDANAFLSVGESLSFSATAVYTDGRNELITDKADWQSSNASILIVNNDGENKGQAVALAEGDVSITVSYLNKQGTFDIRVEDLAPPTELKTTSGTEQIVLTWLANPNGGEYEVYRSDNLPVSTDKLVYAAGTNTTFTDTDVIPGKTYYYAVRTTTEHQEVVYAGPLSNPVSGVANAILPAKPEIKLIEKVNAIRLEWQAVEGAVRYLLSYDVSGEYLEPEEVNKRDIGNVTFFEHAYDEQFTGNYRLIGVNTLGQEGQASDLVTGSSLPPIPQAPATLDVTSTDIEQVSLKWTASKYAQAYTVYVGNNESVGPDNHFYAEDFTDSFATITNLPFGADLYFRVTARNNTGESVPSPLVVAKPLAPVLTPPDNLQAAPGFQKVNLSWNSVTNADSYVVRWSLSPGKAATGELLTETNNAFALHEPLNNGEVIYYVVSSKNVDGVESEASKEVSVEVGQLIGDISFKDETLKLCVNAYEKQYTHEFINLICTDYEGTINDLSGIEYFTSLNNLDIAVNKNTELTLLKILGNNLLDLKLIGEPHADASAIEALEFLNSLTIINGPLTPNQLTQIAASKSITILVLNNNSITDLTPLLGLKTLVTLDLASNAINNLPDANQWAGLEKLTKLELSANNIFNIDAIALSGLALNYLGLASQGVEALTLPKKWNLPSLQTLNLAFNPINDVTSIRQLTGLKQLSLNNNSISTGVSRLATLNKADSIDLNSNPSMYCSDVKSLGWALDGNYDGESGIVQWDQCNANRPLSDVLTQVSDPDLRNCIVSTEAFYAEDITLLDCPVYETSIDTLDGLELLTNLSDLSITDNKFADISKLRQLENLQGLDFSYSSNIDFDVIADLSGLAALKLSSSNVNSLEFILSLGNLQYLDLSYNDLNSIGNLASLELMEKLILEGNAIQDISSLSGMKNLIELHARSNLIVKVDPLQKMQNLLYLDLSYNRIINPSLLGDVTSLITLDLSSNNIAKGVLPLGKIYVQPPILIAKPASSISNLANVEAALLVTDPVDYITRLSLYDNPNMDCEEIAELDLTVDGKVSKNDGIVLWDTCASNFFGKYNFDGNYLDSSNSGRSELSASNTTFSNNTLYLNGIYDLDDSAGYSVQADIPDLDYENFTLHLNFNSETWAWDRWSKNNIITGGRSTRWISLRHSEGNLQLTLNNQDFVHTFANSSLANNFWHTVMLSFSRANNQILLMLNGKVLETVDISKINLDVIGSVWENIDRKFMFTNYSNADVFHGHIDNFDIFDKALTVEEMKVYHTVR